MFPNQCPLCRGTASLWAYNGIDARIECGRCGTFKLTRRLYDTTLEALNREMKELLPYLSAHTRQASERGEEILLEVDNWKDYAMAHRAVPVSRKLFNLLELIARRTTPGKPTNIFDTDAPLLDAVDSTELSFLLGTQNDFGCTTQLNKHAVILKAKGWEQIQAATISGIPGKCFVAMSFDEDLKKPIFHDGIEPAIRIDCKMEPVRIDLVPHNDNIIDKIIAEIRTCQFMVADFTGNKAGVYFEAGFAKGLGREVIWTCRKDHFENIHFDIAQFSHIVWQDPHDLRTRLADRIKATIPGAT